jgi:hypothetical protein
MIRKWMMLIFLIFVISFTSACAGAGDVNKPIEPGDKIGNFVITTGEEGNFTYGFFVECQDMGAANTYSCNVTTGEVINVSTGLYDTTGTGNLDEIWTHSNYAMFINDRPVDLQAFGTIDFTHPQLGVIRFANVVISSDKEGEITVVDSGLYDNGDPFTSTSTYKYTTP